MVVGGGVGRPPEATGGRRCQLPRTDFSPCRKPSPLPTPSGPLKLRLFGELRIGKVQTEKLEFREFICVHVSILVCMFSVTLFFHSWYVCHMIIVVGVTAKMSLEAFNWFEVFDAELQHVQRG